VRFERLPSFLLSLCLHLALMVLALFWPASRAPQATPAQGRLVSGLVSIGKEGKNLPGARPLVPEAAKSRPEKAPSIEKPPTQPPVKSLPSVDAPDKPQPRPDVRPVEKPRERPEPNTVAIPKDPVKKEPPVNATRAESPPKNAPAADPPKKQGSAVAESLKDLSKEVGGNKGRSGARGTSGGRGQTLASALNDLGREVGSAGTAETGQGPGGEGGDGYGVLGSYQESIISRVSANWAWPGRTDRRKYTTIVNIQIDPDGTIKKARIISSSGNAYFDATVLQAVAATNNLEPPPRPDCADIDIRFTPEALGAQ
jgi:TonB family protein